jgi:hypothetical protein
MYRYLLNLGQLAREIIIISVIFTPISRPAINTEKGGSKRDMEIVRWN